MKMIQLNNALCFFVNEQSNSSIELTSLKMVIPKVTGQSLKLFTKCKRATYFTVIGPKNMLGGCDQ